MKFGIDFCPSQCYNLPTNSSYRTIYLSFKLTDHNIYRYLFIQSYVIGKKWTYEGYYTIAVNVNIFFYLRFLVY